MTQDEEGGAAKSRFFVQRKMAVVTRLLRGEPLELVAEAARMNPKPTQEPESEPYFGPRF